ncbi:MAG: thermonuclease family protein, partial [Candidatus Poribacteria bacterium]|nr:thermonuclease family protein [Candidatus Poribacteria bacterium]
VIDGDTFEITSGKKIRLNDVYAPEASEDGGSLATTRLKNLIDRKSVKIQELYSSYDRVVSEVWRNSDGLHVNQAMRDFGYTKKS